MNRNWVNDKRLAQMSQEKLAFLNEFATVLSKSSKNEMTSAYLSMSMSAKQKKIHFTEKETDLLLSVFSEDMSPQERQRMDALKLLTKKLAVHHP